MKKIILLILSFAYCIPCICQQLTFHSGVIINLPKEAKKLNKDELISFAASEKFHVSQLLLNPQYVYQLDDVLIALYDFKGDFKERSLEEDKNSSSSMHRHSHNLNFTSVIKTFNNYKVLIERNTNNDVITYSFYSINNTKTSILNGIIECRENDAAKASALVDNLIQHIQFANN